MVTLESTKAAFSKWRATRSNSSSPIPEKLWDMIRQLLQTHKRSEICKILHISGGQIKKHCDIVTPAKNLVDNKKAKAQVSTNNFVAAIPAPITAEKSTSELIFKCGAKSLQLNLPTSALCDVLPIFGELF